LAVKGHKISAENAVILASMIVVDVALAMSVTGKTAFILPARMLFTTSTIRRTQFADAVSSLLFTIAGTERCWRIAWRHLIELSPIAISIALLHRIKLDPEILVHEGQMVS
jgi:hypothetical protein